MRRKNVIRALLCSACLAAGSIAPASVVSADAMRVVTLGADLTEEQQNTMLRYFKVNANEVEIMYITNEDEREHLSSYVPLSQIGTRTVSCAYVRPTDSGGIKVRTANLNWVTGNMIASTLSTSGVKNCEVIAACPFEVSGTGALTGIQMAYEEASGEKLDETKKQIATEEIVVTGNLADEVGKNDATTVVNQSKMEVIANNIQNADEIYNLVQNIAIQNNVTINDEQLNQIVELLKQIAEQNYEYEDVKDTLERVDENVTGENTSDTQNGEENTGDTSKAESTKDPENTEDSAEPDEDSIMNDVDESVLGEDVKASSTEDPTLEQETGAVEELEQTGEPGGDLVQMDEGDDLVSIPEPTDDGVEDELSAIPEATEDGTVASDNSGAEGTENSDTNTEGAETPDTNTEGTETPDANAEGTETSDTNTEGTEASDGSAEDALDKTLLSAENLEKFEKLEKFCKGEYEGDAASLQEAVGEEAYVSVVLETETAQKLSKEILNTYYKVLTDPTYVSTETYQYMSSELNMMYEQLQKLFSVDGRLPEGEDILAEVSQEDKQALFDDTVKFFEKLYGEEIYEDGASLEGEESYSEDGSAEGASADGGSSDEYYEEEVYTEDQGIDVYTEEVYTE